MFTGREATPRRQAVSMLAPLGRTSAATQRRRSLTMKTGAAARRTARTPGQTATMQTFIHPAGGQGTKSCTLLATHS